MVVHANRDRFEGLYNNGVKEGHGLMYYHTGEIYIGEWKNGMRHGSGVQILQNQVSYIGLWRDDQKLADTTEDVYCNNQERHILTKRYVWNNQGTTFLASRKKQRYRQGGK